MRRGRRAYPTLSRRGKIMLGGLYVCALLGMLVTVLIVTGCRPSEPLDNRNSPSQRYIAELGERTEPPCRCRNRPGNAPNIP